MCGRDFGNPGRNNLDGTRDPFQGIDLTDDNRLANDVDTGLRRYEAATGSLVYHEVGTLWSFCVAAWLDDETFILLGSLGMVPPVPGLYPSWAPAVWVGNAREGTLTAYCGVPQDPVERTAVPDRSRDLWKVEAPCWKRLYPAVRWDE